jgi:fibronectin type 3 domain-containing protein
LSWTPSTSSNVASYNIYRILSSSSTPPPTPYSSLGSILATTCSATVCTYIDIRVQAGQSYWYYATAVNTGGSESVPSNIVQAVVPTP